MDIAFCTGLGLTADPRSLAILPDSLTLETGQYNPIILHCLIEEYGALYQVNCLHGVFRVLMSYV